MNVRILIALSLLVTSCASGGHVAQPQNLQQQEIFDLIDKTMKNDQKVSARQVRSFISNQTIKTYNENFKTQFEFHSADGRTFLWFPGNRRIVRGKWKVERRKTNLPYSKKPYSIAMLCYIYGPDTYNPVTKQKGGKWKCISPNLVFKTKSAKRRGDVFGLSQRSAVPFVLARKKYSFIEITKMMKR